MNINIRKPYFNEAICFKFFVKSDISPYEINHLFLLILSDKKVKSGKSESQKTFNINLFT